MTELEWLTCADPRPMLDLLRGKGSERKLRLLACACCRRIWQQLADNESRTLITVAEEYADGLRVCSKSLRQLVLGDVL